MEIKDAIEYYQSQFGESNDLAIDNEDSEGKFVIVNESKLLKDIGKRPRTTAILFNPSLKSQLIWGEKNILLDVVSSQH